MMYLLALLAVAVAVFVFTEILAPELYRRYRKRVPSADALPRMGLYVDHFLCSGSTVHILQGEEVPWYELFFLKRDIKMLQASGIQPRLRYLKHGKVVDHTTEQFKAELERQEIRIRRAYLEYGGRERRVRRCLGDTPYECSRELYSWSA